jgi:hypothetical protein
VAAIGLSQRLLHEIEGFTHTWWSIHHPKDLRSLPEVRPGLVLADASIDGHNSYGCPAYEIFAGAIESMAIHRPLVVVFGKPVTKWSSAQAALADNENMISDFVQSSGDVGDVFYDRTTALGSRWHTLFNSRRRRNGCSSWFSYLFKFPFLSKKYFATAASSDSGQPGSIPYQTICNAVHDFLRPLSTFRVTKLEQIWPREHQIQLNNWKKEESVRALAIKRGQKVKAPDVVVFDSCLMHKDARGFRWDIREYWQAEADGEEFKCDMFAPLHGINPPLGFQP